jgi:putative salt-induced outer membrane protein YdiY
MVRDRIGVFALGLYERNRFAGLSRRTEEGIGLAWTAITTRRDSLGFDAGPLFTQEQYVRDTAMSFPGVRLTSDLTHRFETRVTFEEGAQYIAETQDNGAHRLTSETSLVAPLTSHIGMRLDYLITYDSRPAHRYRTTDRNLTGGFQFSF